jgi:phosphoglycolate phosphatase
MKVPKLIVYDLDGTLVDSASVVADILNEIRVELGKKPLRKEAFYPWLSLGGEDLVGNGLGVSQNNISSYLTEFRHRYINRATPKDCVYDGVFECLDYLKQANFYLALCTNKPRVLAEKVLIDSGLKKYFEFIVAGGDLPNKKPHPSNLISCQNYFGVCAEQMILVGDSKVDQKLASNSNVPFIFYPHGYDDGVDIKFVCSRLDNHKDFINLCQLKT